MSETPQFTKDEFDMLLGALTDARRAFREEEQGALRAAERSWLPPAKKSRAEHARRLAWMGEKTDMAINRLLQRLAEEPAKEPA